MQNKKKLLVVINSLNFGGAEKSLVSFLNTIDLNRFDIFLQMFNPIGGLISLLPRKINILPKLDFIEYSELPLRNKIITFRWKYLFSLARLKINLRKDTKLHDAQVYWKCCESCFEKNQHEYDIAIGWGQGNPTHYVCECVNAKLKFAWINADYESVGHNKEFDYPYYKKVDNIIAVSETLKDKLCKVFPEFHSKIKIILDIINETTITQMANEFIPFRDIEEIVIVTTGRLVKPKGYDLLVETADTLVERGIQYKWYIIGEGPERRNIEKYIEQYDLSEKLILLGSQSNPYPYMKNCDIYVQTSIYEGYCITLAEARILNKPIVTTNFEVAHDQIQNEYNGLLVEKNAVQICDAIIRLINDLELRNLMVKNLRKEKKGNVNEIEKFYSLLN